MNLNEVKQKEYNVLAEKFHNALFNSKEEDRKKAIAYLNSRGFRRDIVDKFKIGWCPPKAPIRHDLEFLKGRIVFPTVDEYGDVIGFSGRLLLGKEDIKSDEKRWMNESYNKTFCLYGLDVALPNILKENKVVIVEGQTDVLACHKHGINTAIGLMSDDLNSYQISKLMRFTNVFILMLDGDKAGIKSRDNIINKRIGKESNRIRNLKLHIVDLMVGDKEYDPDSYIIDLGVDSLKEKIKRSTKDPSEKKHG